MECVTRIFNLRGVSTPSCLGRLRLSAGIFNPRGFSIPSWRVGIFNPRGISSPSWRVGGEKTKPLVQGAGHDQHPEQGASFFIIIMPLFAPSWALSGLFLAKPLSWVLTMAQRLITLFAFSRAKMPALALAVASDIL